MTRFETEVHEMMQYYGVTEKEAELKAWYDGYLFGSKEIYNPWSVINYLSKGCIPQPYWVNTGKNEILEDVLQVATDDIIERLFSLLQGKSVIARIDQNVVAIAEYMDKSISFYDAGAEGFYHGLVLGLIALMDNQYKITSNRESEDGRYDISLMPREKRYPGIIMELKWNSNLNAEDLERLAEDALAQINEKRYNSEMMQEGVENILKLGIAFSGKKVKIKAE